MHHIHGVVNVLLTALWNGATCEFMPKFDAPGVSTIPTVLRLLLLTPLPSSRSGSASFLPIFLS